MNLDLKNLSLQQSLVVYCNIKIRDFYNVYSKNYSVCGIFDFPHKYSNLGVNQNQTTLKYTT
ncbi:hypothetical protein pb186bvf_001737 [Paramecium bursaria]